MIVRMMDADTLRDIQGRVRDQGRGQDHIREAGREQDQEVHVEIDIVLLNHYGRWSRSSSSGRGPGSRSPRRHRDHSPLDSAERQYRESGEFSSAIPYLQSRSMPSSRYSPPSIVYGQPHYKIVMKMLPQGVQRDALMAQIARQGFHVKDIRIIHKSPDRCFGFVEFADVSSAQAWMEFNKGTLVLRDGRQIKLEYSRYDSLDGRSNSAGGAGDWMCAKCTIKNFKNRGSCFKCNLTRNESDGLTRKGYAAIGVAKCDTLLLREIPLKCTESKIEAELGRVSSLEVLRVHIAESGMYAYVQMRSADDAERLMLTFNKIPLLIDGCTIMVTYSRLPLNTVLSTSLLNDSYQKASDRINQLSAFRPTAGSSGQCGVEAAQLAIAKAALIRQITNSMTPADAYQVPHLSTVLAATQEANFVVTDHFRDELSSQNFVCVDDITDPNSTHNTSSTVQGPTELGEVETPWGIFKKYPTPNPTLYQFESSSGLYYDPATKLYYDSNSQYYWNAGSQQWNSWNATYQTYIPCDSINNNLSSVKAEPMTVQDKEVGTQINDKMPSIEQEKAKEAEKKEPQKSAKDIAREMAKWAKRQSKVLLAVKAPAKLENVSPLVSGSSKPKSLDAIESTADLTFKMLEKASNPFGSGSDEEEEEANIPPKVSTVGIYRSALNSISVHAIKSNVVSSSVTEESIDIKKTNNEESESFVDTERKFCNLCKRKFGSVEVLMKHIRMSDLHKKNLEALQKANDVSLIDTATTSFSTGQGKQQYRDRAKERRNMFGLDPSGFTFESSDADIIDYAVRSQDVPIDQSNIGNRLLKSMGWIEGSGIGKNNQGILNPISTERRVEGAGLGAAGSKVLHGANASRKERAHSAMLNRFQELS
ncbi:unnamed protein product [Dracunculus medinensis]|uniref:G-patch domain-containing protein n=1 Tax=Dracunculus medinensis TaxID=318479 RepID=A0A0N4UQI9_DRAME|nr:unnamed protein product [Dracunculus medinensis]